MDIWRVRKAAEAKEQVCFQQAIVHLAHFQRGVPMLWARNTRAEPIRLKVPLSWAVISCNASLLQGAIAIRKAAVFWLA